MNAEKVGHAEPSKGAGLGVTARFCARPAAGLGTRHEGRPNPSRCPDRFLGFIVFFAVPKRRRFPPDGARRLPRGASQVRITRGIQRNQKQSWRRRTKRRRPGTQASTDPSSRIDALFGRSGNLRASAFRYTLPHPPARCTRKHPANRVWE